MHTSAETLIVVTTGGTIDKAYFDASSDYQVGDSVVAKLLAVARVTLPWRAIEHSRKDSLDMTDEDRAALRATIAALPEHRIIITHGTDTMTDSAQALSSITDKTIVFTGALAPARFSESDASFNLGMAFAAAQSLPAGIYITMNGQVFQASEVRKDRASSQFVRRD
jgi:L-asparaginase